MRIDVERLQQNLTAVRARIRKACRIVGREPSAVRLVAVTKAVGIDAIRALADLGERCVGESRVLDALAKADRLADVPIEWHMIGHLQTNKVNKALPFFRLIHSVDSLKLAQSISRRATALDTTADVLVQVNTSGEPSKFGLAPDEVEDVMAQVSALAGVNVRGLMTMAPLVVQAEKTRPVFRRLRLLAEKLRESGLAGADFGELSMGMSNDFSVAVEEGSTMVRIGSRIFEGVESP